MQQLAVVSTTTTSKQITPRGVLRYIRCGSVAYSYKPPTAIITALSESLAIPSEVHFTDDPPAEPLHGITRRPDRPNAGAAARPLLQPLSARQRSRSNEVMKRSAKHVHYFGNGRLRYSFSQQLLYFNLLTIDGYRNVHRQLDLPAH